MDAALGEVILRRYLEVSREIKELRKRRDRDTSFDLEEWLTRRLAERLKE